MIPGLLIGTCCSEIPLGLPSWKDPRLPSRSTLRDYGLTVYVRLPQALSIIFTGVSIAPVAAPLGTFLGDLIGWRGVFPVGGALGLLGFQHPGPKDSASSVMK